MIVLGIDPGIAITGCAAIEEQSGKTRLLYQKALTTPSTDSLTTRLMNLYKDMRVLLQTCQPDIVAIEQLFFNTNAKTALIVGHACGIIQLAIAQNDIPIAEYTPLQVKMAITGYGRAEKKQIQHMVQNILKLRSPITQDDIADAAAIALTHCFSYKLRQREALSIKH